MKRLILMAVAVSLMSMGAMAQNMKNAQGRKLTPTEMAQKRTEKMVKQYNLNAMQAKQLQELNKDWEEDVQERQKERAEEMAEYNGKLQKILGPETYQKFQNDRKARMQHKGKKCMKSGKMGNMPCCQKGEKTAMKCLCKDCKKPTCKGKNCTDAQCMKGMSTAGK